MSGIDTDTVTFSPPGPGYWELDTTHRGFRPLSHLVRAIGVRAIEAGAEEMVRRYGLPLTRIRVTLVEGCVYMRPQAVGEGSKPTKPPPKPIMALIAACPIDVTVRLSPPVPLHAFEDRKALARFGETAVRSEVVELLRGRGKTTD